MHAVEGLDVGAYVRRLPGSGVGIAHGLALARLQEVGDSYRVFFARGRPTTMIYLKIAAAVFLGHYLLNWTSAFVAAFERSRRWQLFFEYTFAAIAILVCVI
jgi:hypothetical protein